MQMVMKVMPAILVVFGIQFPAALVLYWLTTNLWTIVQQRIILGRLGPAPATGAGTVQGVAQAKGANSKGKSVASTTTPASKKSSPSSPNGASKNSPATTKTGAKSPNAANKKRRKR